MGLIETSDRRLVDAINLDKYNSVVADHKHDTLSKKYNFASSKEIIEVLSDSNWFPVAVNQGTVRKQEFEGYQKHAVVLANKDFETQIVTSGTLPRIVLRNSHDGKSALQIISGLYERICANGLMVGSDSGTIRYTHMQFTPEKLAEGIKYIQDQLIRSLEFADTAKAITLSQDEETILAESAIEMAFDGEKYAVKPREVLYRRHYGQKEPTLWNSFNAIQENIIKGGVRQTRENGTRIQSRAVKNIDRNIALNKGLWLLAEKMKDLKQAGI